ncbi:uncharacterized protein BJX67DRAFT_368583 [Aspergillus lucknowensis]|uniref:Uncharacterized protein n=1 Tax=Aspergillus lucknowensis TaxID=176173 RepID=A0ABR4L6T3_9EURO
MTSDAPCTIQASSPTKVDFVRARHPPMDALETISSPQADRAFPMLCTVTLTGMFCAGWILIPVSLRGKSSESSAILRPAPIVSAASALTALVGSETSM